MSDYTPITATIGVLGFLLSLYNLWYSHHEPVRKIQATKRLGLKEKLHPLDFYRLNKVLGSLENTIPSSRIKDELQAIKQYLLITKDEFIAPTPDQLTAFIAVIDQTLHDWMLRPGRRKLTRYFALTATGNRAKY